MAISEDFFFFIFVFELTFKVRCDSQLEDEDKKEDCCLL